MYRKVAAQPGDEARAVMAGWRARVDQAPRHTPVEVARPRDTARTLKR
jgi:hypothetical protein